MYYYIQSHFTIKATNTQPGLIMPFLVTQSPKGTSLDFCFHSLKIETGNVKPGLCLSNTHTHTYKLTKVTLACDDSITVWTMELCHVLCVFLQNVHLHGAALCETGMADVALVGLLT